MATPALKVIDSNDSVARQREKINTNFSRLGVPQLATGFVADNNNQDIGIDYNASTRKITLDGTFKAYHQGVLIPELTNGWVSSAHANDIVYPLMTNLITNGDFSGGVTGWSLATMTTVSSTGNEYIGIATAINGRIQQPVATVSGHMVYRSAMVKSTSSLVGIGTGTSRLKNHSGSGNYELLSIVSSEGATLWTSIIDGRSSAWTNTYVKYVMTLDLTALYGSGKEPTAAQMDAILASSNFTNSWFDGTVAAKTYTYFLRHDGTQFLFDTTPWDIEKDTLIASVQYGASLKIVCRECHGVDMPGIVHKRMHDELGTGRVPNGTIFSNWVADSTTAANRRPYISGVTLADEDLETAVPNLSTNSYCVRYLTGSTANGTRTFLTAQTDIVKLSGNQPYYNEWTGSAWTDTLFPNNHYGKLFVVAIPAAKNADSQAVRFMFVQPQTTSLDISVIRAISSSDIKHGDPTSLVSEYNFIGEVIIHYTSSNWVIKELNVLTGNRVQQTKTSAGYGLATATTDGLMSSTDFMKLQDTLYDADKILSITVGSGKDYATLNEAIATLPPNLGGTEVTITVDAGTYTDNVWLENYYNGAIIINGAALDGSNNATTTLSTIVITRCTAYIRFTNFKLSGGYDNGTSYGYVSALVDDSQYVNLTSVQVTYSTAVANSSSFFVSANSGVYMGSYCKCGTAPYGVRVTSLSDVYIGSAFAFGTHSVAPAIVNVGSTLHVDTYSTAGIVTATGGSVLAAGGLFGDSMTYTDGVCSFSGNMIAFRSLGLAIIAGLFTVKTTQSIAADTSVTLGTFSIGANLASTALNTYRAQNSYSMAYINTTGGITFRSGLSIAAGGTMFVSGVYPIAH